MKKLVKIFTLVLFMALVLTTTVNASASDDLLNELEQRNNRRL